MKRNGIDVYQPKSHFLWYYLFLRQLCISVTSLLEVNLLTVELTKVVMSIVMLCNALKSGGDS